MIRDTQPVRAQLLRWAGSKRQSAGEIASHIDFGRTYIEPFCGSASFFFQFRPQRAVLNDSNASLINFYKKLRASPGDVWNTYKNLRTDAASYYRARAVYNELEMGTRKAAYFLYLNHFCFNGLYRTNLQGCFNTPIGSHAASKSKLRLQQILDYATVARSASFYAKDFEDFLCAIQPEGTCIYLDPPYVTRDDRVFGEYSQKPFQLTDLRRLRSVARKLARTNRVVISYKDCSEFRELFARHIVQSVAITRNVGGFRGRRKRDQELVAVLGSR